MPQIGIRCATPKDLAGIKGLIPLSARALQAPYYPMAVIDAALELVCDFGGLIQAGTLVVAERQGQIVGCGGWSLGACHVNNHAQLHGFFVHPDFARRGIATQIIQYCENTCRALGVDTLYLTSTLAGEAFYRKNGFTALGPVMAALSDGETFALVKMQKSF